MTPKYRFVCKRCGEKWIADYIHDPCPGCDSESRRELEEQIGSIPDRRDEDIDKASKQKELKLSGMPIEKLNYYTPKLKLPVYIRITVESNNKYKLWEKYDMAVVDEKRQEEKGGRGINNYIHEALLVGKQKVDYDYIPHVILALDTHSESVSEVEKFIDMKRPELEKGNEVLILTFVRLDKTKEFVTGDTEVKLGKFDKEDAEGNG